MKPTDKPGAKFVSELRTIDLINVETAFYFSKEFAIRGIEMD